MIMMMLLLLLLLMMMMMMMMTIMITRKGNDVEQNYNKKKTLSTCQKRNEIKNCNENAILYVSA